MSFKLTVLGQSKCIHIIFKHNCSKQQNKTTTETNKGEQKLNVNNTRPLEIKTTLDIKTMFQYQNAIFNENVSHW